MLNVKIQNRRDTIENWTSANPVLLSGEFGYVTTGKYKNMFKLGDGSTKWNDLPFAYMNVIKPAVYAVSANTEITTDHDNSIFLVSGNSAVTVSPIENNFSTTIKNVGTGSVTVVPEGTSIDGASSAVALSPNEYISIIQHSNAFYIISTNKALVSMALGEFCVDDEINSNTAPAAE